MPLENWLTVIGGSAFVGGAIDFLIGPEGQRKVRDWLELHWYRVADVAWRNFGRREAEAYLFSFDGIFGRSFFCKKRFVVSALMTTIVTITATTIGIFLIEN